MLERLTSMDGSYVVERFDEDDLPIRSNELPPPNFFERFLSTMDSDSEDDAEIYVGSTGKVRITDDEVSFSINLRSQRNPFPH